MWSANPSRSLYALPYLLVFFLFVSAIVVYMLFTHAPIAAATPDESQCQEAGSGDGLLAGPGCGSSIQSVGANALYLGTALGGASFTSYSGTATSLAKQAGLPSSSSSPPVVSSSGAVSINDTSAIEQL